MSEMPPLEPSHLYEKNFFAAVAKFDLYVNY